MARYIDADELIKIGLQDGAYEYVSVDEIANFPTADVKPVVHGEWILFDGWGLRFKCSSCGYCLSIGAEKTNFCSNCGARMDGAE